MRDSQKRRSNLGGSRGPPIKFLMTLLAILSISELSRGQNFDAANERNQILGDGSKQISDINLLLPVSTCVDCRKVTYNISAINGCYQWEVSHPNLLQLGQIQSQHFSDCANIASLSPISLKASKSLVWLTAKDKYSGQSVRCETKLGVIDKLHILTNFRQFYVDNYEQLHLTGYDDEGNVFSSLEGFSFEWNIEEGNEIVKIVTMKESGKKLSEVKKEMEISKMSSEVLFLKGIKSGTAVVSVKIMEPGYEEVAEARVALTISEPFVILPSQTVFILPTSMYQFTLAKVSLKNHEMQFFPISLPDKQYQWNVDLEEKGIIGEDGVFLSKDKEGLVNILVVDQHIANNSAEGSIKIVYPFYLDIQIVDVTQQISEQKYMLAESLQSSYFSQLNLTEWDNNWILVEGHIYLIKVFVYDREKNPIQLTDNLVFQNLIDEDHFEVLKKNKIDSEMIVKAKMVTGQNQKLLFVSIFKEIKSAIPQYSYPIDQSRLRSEKEVRITKPVNIVHPTDLVLLPLLRVSIDQGSGEIWHLKAEGGSGYYQWGIQNDQVASVSGQGVLRSREIGKTEVTVRDNMNSRNFFKLKVEVSQATALTWLEDHIEIQKKNGEEILNVIALDKQGRKFTNCTGIPIQYDLKGESIISGMGSNHSYEVVKHYVKTFKELLYLKQLFDDDPKAMLITELPNIAPWSPKEEILYTHNNFGICSQQRIVAIGSGLGRGKAYFSSLDTSQSLSKFIESNYVEIAAYEKLETLLPNYNNFFSDLYTLNSVSGQEESMFAKDYLPDIFDVAFGSSLVWTVQGGTNFWKDIKEKYQVASQISLMNEKDGGLDRDSLVFFKLSESTTLFSYQLYCSDPKSKTQITKPHRFQVKLQQQNLQSRHLLRPALHLLTIDVHCEPPQQQKIHWAQESRDLSPIQYLRLPKFKIENNERVNYVLVGSSHYLRSLFYDNSNFVFTNHSSIQNLFTTSNETMLKLHALSQDYSSQVQMNVHDKRKVEVMNLTGTVYIYSLASGYYSNFLAKPSTYSGYWGSSSDSTDKYRFDHEVSDRMRVEIVRNVDIQPKFKSVYFSAKGNEFRFRIFHGSGHFQVHLNNSDLADVIERDRNVTVYPKQEGSLEIMIEDVELPEAEFAVAELLISDIARLELDAPGSLIEQGSWMELTVSAFDNHGKEFDADQYLLMDFNIEIEMTGVARNRGINAVHDPENNRKFQAEGIEPGNYQLTAYSYRFKPIADSYRGGDSQIRSRVTSDLLKIEVFPLLEIHPGSLLLTPLMRYTLQIVGGPSRTSSSQFLSGGTVEIKFDIENKTVASIDIFREVTGHQVGETKLYYEVIQLKPNKLTGVEKRSIISKKTVPIRVQLVTSIEIPQNDQREVFQGSMIKMNGILKYHGETFTHGVAPISYSWNCSNPNIVNIQLPIKDGVQQIYGSNIVMASKKIRDNQLNKNDVVFFTQFNSSSVYALGGTQGEAWVTLLLAIEYPSLYKHSKNYFSTRISLKVAEKLSIGVPEFMQNPELQTHLYLMPPHTQAKIETNKKTRLRLGQSKQSVYDYSTHSYQEVESQTPIISLINDEVIRTQDRYGKVTVIVEENQAFSGQVVMLNVLVTDIYNIAVKEAYQAMNLPLGSTMQLQVKFQNDHAHLFANNIEGIDVSVELSHPRVVNAELDEFNQTLTLQAMGSGDCNVIVYQNQNPAHVYDVFKVRVTSIVKPPSPVQLHVGGSVQFKIMNDKSQIMDQDISHSGAIWSSNSPSILDINQLTGEARGLQEGKADVLLSNHISAASIVHVSKVKFAEIDEKSRKNMILQVDQEGGFFATENEARFRIKLFFNDQLEEVMPTVQFDGITLIRQNVVLHCENDHPMLLTSYPETSDLEGYFCVVKLKQLTSSEKRAIPKSSKVTVYVSAPSFIANAQDKSLYKEKILSFEVTLVSNIKVESRYRSGVRLNKDHRTADIKILSNVDFLVEVQNQAMEDKEYELVRHRVNRSEEGASGTNEYFLTVAVPREITHDFTSNVVLTHPLTNKKITIPVYFEGREGETGQEQAEVNQEEPVGYLNWLFGSGEPERDLQREAQQEVQREPAKPEVKGRPDVPKDYYSRHERPSLGSYFIILMILILIILFILVNIFRIDPAEAIKDLLQGRLPGQRRNVIRRQHQDFFRGAPAPAQVRNPIQRQLFPTQQVAPPPATRGFSPPSYRFSPPSQHTPSARSSHFSQGNPPAQGTVRAINLEDFHYSQASGRNQSSRDEGSPQRHRPLY